MIGNVSPRLARLAFLTPALFTTSVFAQGVTDSGEVQQRLAWHQEHVRMAANTPYDQNSWQFVGPEANTGRVTDVEVHPSAPNTIYAASCSGGVWKSIDGAATWTPIFDNQATASIGDIAIAPSDPDIIWVGTGEANIFRSSMAGVGVYKSTDAGASFTYMGLGDTQTVARVVIHPNNPNVVYVAAAGNEYQHNEERGVYKTTNGGVSWEKVFYRGPDVGVIDLAMDPSAPGTLYAGTAERLRLRWSDPRPGSQSGLYKTTDGGETWVALTRGLPDFSSGEYERVGIDVCRSQPNTVYALLNHAGGPGGGGSGGAELYRSNDKGETWSLCEGTDSIRRLFPAYGWVFGQVRVHPADPETVYVMGVSYSGSTDGGKTFTGLRGSHADYHAMWINPQDADHILVGNDGGLMVSHDRLESFTQVNNLPITTPFNVAVSNTHGQFWLYCCVQDFSGMRGLVDVSGDRANVTWMQRWERAPGDEAGRQAVDPTDPTIVYSVRRYGGGPSRTVVSMGATPPREPGARRGGRAGGARAQRGARGRGGARAQRGARGRGGARGQRGGRGRGGQRGGGRGRRGRGGSGPDFGSERKRAQWVSPIVISPHDNQRALFGAQFVFLTDNSGETWQRISPDLTNYDPEKQGNIQHAVVFAIAESPVEKGVIYAGTDDGNMQVTRDQGQSWTLIADGLPEGRCISSIEASHFDAGTVFMTISGRRHNDFESYVYKSTDYGENWTLISNNIPGSPANVIRQDPVKRDLLYVGTDKGVYVSTDGGEQWNVLGKGLPTVYAQDLVVQTKEDYAVISTHGRGCWVLDIRDLRRN